jgi:DNA-binding transcriptional ArsR family regulator
LTTRNAPALIDPRLLKALAHPTRQLILDILGRGPSSPVRISRQLDGVSLNLVSHHMKVLHELDCVELMETVQRRGATEHVYRGTKLAMLTAAEWEQIDLEHRYPITANLLRLISEDTNRALAEGTFEARADNHLSRVPVELDREGWGEIVGILAQTLEDVLEVHAKSAERARASGEDLETARIVMMQYLIGRQNPEGDG